MKRALLAFALAGCGVLLPASGPPTHAPVFALMHRFGCLGTFPDYQITVYANGVVEYDGNGWVHVHGARTTDIGAAGVELLRRQLDRAGFLALGDDYTSKIDDACGISWIEYQGKRVTFEGGYQGVPGQLFGLAARFEELSHSERWAFGTDDDGHERTP